jgi:hypothetical protein
MEEAIAHWIPFFRGLNVADSSFFSHPLLPEFLDIYGSQIRTVRGPDYPQDVAFFEALPNLTQLSTHWLGDNVPAVKMPALERLELFTLRSGLSESAGRIDFHFLQNFPNLTHLCLPYMNICEHVTVLSALESYFKKQYGLEGSSRRTLTIFLCPYNDFPSELKTAEKDQVAVPSAGRTVSSEQLCEVRSILDWVFELAL